MQICVMEIYGDFMEYFLHAAILKPKLITSVFSSHFCACKHSNSVDPNIR